MLLQGWATAATADGPPRRGIPAAPPAEATEKAYCDEQMAKTEAKKGELEDDIAKMTAKIDSAASRSAQLKEEVKVLQEELAALSREQAQMDKIRLETHEEYKVAKADLELGLTGVRKALGQCRGYSATPMGVSDSSTRRAGGPQRQDGLLLGHVARL